MKKVLLITSFLIFALCIHAQMKIVPKSVLLTIAKEQEAEAEKENTLNNRLAKMRIKGQEARNVYIEAIREYKKTGDKTNLARLKSAKDLVDNKNQRFVANILDSIGWPPELDQEANNAIFFIINYADLDFSKKHLHWVEKASQLGIISPISYATLHDRILMRSKEPQIYGTQTIQIGNETYLWPIQNPDTLNERRLSVKLPRISEFFAIVKSTSKREVIWDREKTVSDFSNK